ncbi:MAG: hypothetical protein MZV70_66885 [Desulfobacterales bacterium]|nr:hypothetical protein [Desulfobacterales bacterium]
MLESPTQDKKAVDACVAFAAREFKKVGCKVTVQPQKDVGDLIVAEFAPGRVKDADDEVLVLTHIDTVWPVGKIVQMPFFVQGNRLYGPGVLDMKAGLAMLLRLSPGASRAQRQAPEEDHRLRQLGRGDRQRRGDGDDPQAGPPVLAGPLPRTRPSGRGPEARAEGPSGRPHGRRRAGRPTAGRRRKGSAPSRSWWPRSPGSSA